MKIKFEQMCSPEVEQFITDDGVVLLPIGACEEHGRHLPLITDTKIAYQVDLEATEIVSKKMPI